MQGTSAPRSVDARRNAGFVYVATGGGYLEEARRSAESLRRFNPDFPICLVTDTPLDVGEGLFDVVIACANAEHKPIDKLYAFDCPFEFAVFLDTDTRVFGDLSALFDLLDRFDLALHQDVHRGWNYELPDVPVAFTEFNTGVIAFRRSEALLQFVANWRGNYESLNVEQGLVNDQPSFRRTIYHSSLRVAPLPSEFHFLGNFPNYILWKVRLIHARGDLDLIARQVDETLGARVYLPSVGVVHSFRGRGNWLRISLLTAWRMLGLVFNPPQDSSGGNPRKWWLEEARPSNSQSKVKP